MNGPISVILPCPICGAPLTTLVYDSTLDCGTPAWDLDDTEGCPHADAMGDDPVFQDAVADAAEAAEL